MNNFYLTYSGKLPTLINLCKEKNLDVRYTINPKTGKVTTTSILINDIGVMITFNYQDLKSIVEGLIYGKEIK